MRLTLLFICLLIVSSSCDEKVFTGDVNCDECYSEKPDEADLVIDLTINYNYPAVLITVYSGNIESGTVVASEYADYTPYYVYVPVNHTYSVRAEYIMGNETLYAVDGTNLKVLSVTDACTDKCYVIENEKLDVRLKQGFP